MHFIVLMKSTLLVSCLLQWKQVHMVDFIFQSNMLIDASPSWFVLVDACDSLLPLIMLLYIFFD